MKIQKNISLQKFNTLKTGGRASFFCITKNIADLKCAAEFANKNKQRIFILGDGSNLLVSDHGFNGLVIKNEIKGIEVCKSTNGRVEVEVCAGENWDKFVVFCVNNNLWGTENLSLIPGTVGAGCVQNIGAYGVEISKIVKKVEIFNVTNNKIKYLVNSDCKFGYRDSFFKKKAGRDYIITKVYFSLKKDGAPLINYKDLKKEFANKIPKLRDVRSAVIRIRNSKLPDMRKIGTAGSFFKNLVLDRVSYKKISLKFQDLPATRVENGKYKISLAWIIDKVCGLSGYRTKNVGLHKKQPLVIVNYGKSKSKDIYNFSTYISEAVESKVGVKPEKEVVLVGDF